MTPWFYSSFSSKPSLGFHAKPGAITVRGWKCPVTLLDEKDPINPFNILGIPLLGGKKDTPWYVGWSFFFIEALPIYAFILFDFVIGAPVLHDVWARKGDGNNSCQASVPVKAGGAVLVVLWQLSPAPCQSNAIGMGTGGSSIPWSSASGACRWVAQRAAACPHGLPHHCYSALCT